MTRSGVMHPVCAEFAYSAATGCVEGHPSHRPRSPRPAPSCDNGIPTGSTEPRAGATRVLSVTFGPDSLGDPPTGR
ncbi:hypothetical protein NSERUTF1_7501 [Nocardia seriolae]|nr:hypothetical protein NSERUTF1_7501 [Nocardia seriolae]